MGAVSNVVSASLSYFEPPVEEPRSSKAGLIAGVTVGGVALIAIIFAATGIALNSKKKARVSSKVTI